MEQSFVAWAKMRARNLPQVKLGIGDDAAILAASSQDRVVTCDTLTDGVHFELGKVDTRRIGRKLVSANLSDLAAMGAEPEAAFVSACLPTNSPVGAPDALAAELHEGICEACERHATALAGGDTNCWTGPLVLSMTAIGRVVDEHVWRRSGAQADDLVVVTGPLGGSIEGKHLDFEPRFDIVRAIRGKVSVHAAMDISDGLSVDLLRMCDASGCGAILELDEIPLTPAAHRAAQQGGKPAVEHALGDGEDFELLLAIPADEFPQLQRLLGSEQAIRCGTFTSRTGLWARDGGRIRQLTTSGYLHGR